MGKNLKFFFSERFFGLGGLVMCGKLRAWNNLYFFFQKICKSGKKAVPACYGSAQDLWQKIHEYELIGYLSTIDVDAAAIYAAICTYFGKLSYSERNFRKYR